MACLHPIYNEHTALRQHSIIGPASICSNTRLFLARTRKPALVRTWHRIAHGYGHATRYPRALEQRWCGTHKAKIMAGWRSSAFAMAMGLLLLLGIVALVSRQAACTSARVGQTCSNSPEPGRQPGLGLFGAPMALSHRCAAPTYASPQGRFVGARSSCIHHASPCSEVVKCLARCTRCTHGTCTCTTLTSWYSSITAWAAAQIAAE